MILILRFSKLRKFLWWGLVVLLILFFGGWAFENWRGSIAWEKAQKRAEEMNVSLVRLDYKAGEVFGEDKIWNDPVFSEEFFREGIDALVSWQEVDTVEFQGLNGGVRPALGCSLKYAHYFKEGLSEEAKERFREIGRRFEGRMEALTEVILSKPDQAMFAEKIVEMEFGDSYSFMLNLQQIAECYESSGLMALRSGDSGKAMVTVRVLDRLARFSRAPSMLNHLLSINIYRLIDNLIWEGIRIRVWTDEDLKALEVLLRQRALAVNLKKVLGYEVAVQVEALSETDSLRDIVSAFEDEWDWKNRLKFWWNFEGPNGWRNQRRAIGVNHYLDLIQALDSPEGVDENAQLTKIRRGKLSPFSEQAIFLESAISVIYPLFEKPETMRRIALVAIMLERFFIKNGAYPKVLSEVGAESEFVDLTDPARQVLDYRLGPDGRPEVSSPYDDDSGTSPLSRRMRWQFWEVES